MGTKSLPGQRLPSGVPWVDGALWCERPRFVSRENPIYGPLPFRGDKKSLVGVRVNDFMTYWQTCRLIWLCHYCSVPEVKLPKIGGSHPFICWTLTKYHKMDDFFDVQFVCYIRESNALHWFNSNSGNRNPSAASCQIWVFTPNCLVCLYLAQYHLYDSFINLGWLVLVTKDVYCTLEMYYHCIVLYNICAICSVFSYRDVNLQSWHIHIYYRDFQYRLHCIDIGHTFTYKKKLVWHKIVLYFYYNDTVD